MSLHDLISSENHLLEDGVTLFTYFAPAPKYLVNAVSCVEAPNEAPIG
jgi:hypothetical protein